MEETGSIINLAILTIFIEFVGPLLLRRRSTYVACSLYVARLLGLYGHIYLMPRLRDVETERKRKESHAYSDIRIPDLGYESVMKQ